MVPKSDAPPLVEASSMIPGKLKYPTETSSEASVMGVGAVKLMLPKMKLVLAGPGPSVPPLNEYTYPSGLLSVGGANGANPPGNAGWLAAGPAGGLSDNSLVSKIDEMEKDDNPAASTVSHRSTVKAAPGATVIEL